MALSVRSVRCTSQSIIFFGFLFTSVASTFAAIHVSRFYYDLKKDKSRSPSGLELFWNYWLCGYPILIGLWSELIGAAGVSTSKPKYARNTLQIASFFICSLILLATESYACYDLISDYLPRALKQRSNQYCAAGDNKYWWSNCHLYLAVTICLIILAAFIILLSLWSVICCCGSLCCRNQVEQEPDEQQVPTDVVQQPTAAQGLMMQGTAAIMVPMLHTCGLPVVPCTVEGNVQAMQSNAIPMMPIASGSHPPLTGVPVLYKVAGQQ